MAIDKKTDYDHWTGLLQEAGVRHVRLHDGRHTAATLQAGRPLQIMYGVAGEHDLTERELPHLAGWRGNRPGPDRQRRLVTAAYAIAQLTGESAAADRPVPDALTPGSGRR